MKRHLLTLSALLLVAPQLTSCRSHSIREGVWKLSMHVQTGLPEDMEVPDRLVAVHIGKDSTGEGEVAEIGPVEEADAPQAPVEGGESGKRPDHPSLELRSMWADIRSKNDNEPPRVQIEGADGFWRFLMWGVVKQHTYVQGLHFSATLRDPKRHLVLEGWWEMRWVRDF